MIFGGRFVVRWIYGNYSGEILLMFTMARIKATRGKGKEFFLNHLSCDDYYSEGERVSGIWHGSLAGELGLEGASVESGVFSLFQQNLNPLTGEKLTQRTVEGGIRFYDFQCSAQKSVSVMGLFDERLGEAHREAVGLAMRELERFAAVRLRSGENVHTQNHENTGRIVYAEFHHDVSRLLDPQLHTHNVVCNVTKDRDGKFKALENTEMCQAIRYCGRVYQNELARRCIELGYEIENSFDFKGRNKGFEIKGVPENVLEVFSQRTRDIDEQIAKKEQKIGRGLTAAEKHEIALDTRSRKMLESDSASVRKEQLERIGFEDLKTLKDLAGKAGECESFALSRSATGTTRSDISFGEIIPELYENASVLKQDQILAEALTQNLGQHTLEMWKLALAQMEELRNIGGEAHNPYMSPETVIEAEEYAIEVIEQERDKCEPLGEDFEPFLDQKNREAQAKVIRGLLKSRDRFMLLRGVAGSGKTSTLQELCRGMRFGGTQDIRLIAPTNSAVEVLKSEGFEQSQTVASFIMNHNDIPRKSAVIVDEAGLNSLREGVALLKAAKEKDFRLIFVGDSRQHSAVENGDFFRLLEKFSNIEKFSLTEIHRQQVADYKAAILDCADGRFGTAFERFDRNEYIHETQADYMFEAAEKYLEFTNNGKDLSQTIVVAPTHAECDKLTAEIRQVASLGETIEQPEVFRSAQWTRAKLGKLKNYEPGMSLMFVRRMKNIANPGEIVTVENVDGKFLHLSNGKQVHVSKVPDFMEVGEKRQIELKEGDLIQFKVNLRDRKIYNGNLARITDSPGIVQLLNQNMEPVKGGLRELPEGFGGYDYGWVATSHKSQGRTANNVIVAAQRLDQKAFYVACSRGRRNLALFCPDKEYLRNNLLKNSSERLTVHEVLERHYIGKIPAAPAKPHIDLNQIQKNRQEHQREFELEKAKYVQHLDVYNKEKSEKQAQIDKLQNQLSELQHQQFVKKKQYKRSPPWQINLWDTIKRTLVNSYNAHIDRQIEALQQKTSQTYNQIYSLKDDLERLPKPKFTMKPEPPIKFPKRLQEWGGKVIHQPKPKLTEIDDLLVRFANANTPETFCDWWKNIRPGERTRVQEMTWKIAQEKKLINLTKLQNLPQTEEQYKVFNRAKKAAMFRFKNYRGAALRRIRQKHDERVHKMEQAIQLERQRFKEYQAMPNAIPNPDLWYDAFSYGRYSEYDRQYLWMIEAAKQSAHQEFIDDRKFYYIKESDLNTMKIPPQLTSDEIELWLLSRTNANMLNTLLEISRNRQQELQMEQQRQMAQFHAEQQRRQQELRAAEEQERKRLKKLPTAEQKQYLQKLVDYGCFLWVSPEITRRQAAGVIAEYAPNRLADESAQEFVRKKLEEYPNMYDYEPNLTKLTWGQYMGFKDELKDYEQEIAHERKLAEQARQREAERERNRRAEREHQVERERQAQTKKKSRGIDL